jgi:NADH:ubiquinone oxidoreductase subunit E
MPKTRKRDLPKPIDPKIIEIAQKHEDKPDEIIEIFQDLQAQQGGLFDNSISDVARSLKIPDHHAYGVATFYSMFFVEKPKKGVIRVCDGPVCWLCGSEEVHQAIADEYRNNNDWKVERTSCLGLCDQAPAALVNLNQAGPILADQVGSLSRGVLGTYTDYSSPRDGEFQVMIAKAGKIDRDSQDSAIDSCASEALKSSLQRSPEEILDEVDHSGLTGRGGAGFPVGRKWRFVQHANRRPKYIICAMLTNPNPSFSKIGY